MGGGRARARPTALARTGGRGTEAVIHVAGVVSAPGSRRVCGRQRRGHPRHPRRRRGKRRAPVRPCLLACPPANRHCPIMAGRRRTAETRGRQRQSLAWTIVRPPGIFGPRDTELLDLFRMARHRDRAAAPGRRARLVDLSRPSSRGCYSRLPPPRLAWATCWSPTTARRTGGTIATSRARSGRRSAGGCCRRPFPARCSGSVRRSTARCGEAAAKLTPDRVRYMTHPDWVSRHAPPPALWRSGVDTRAALTDTARWYRARGLL